MTDILTDADRLEAEGEAATRFTGSPAWQALAVSFYEAALRAERERWVKACREHRCEVDATDAIGPYKRLLHPRGKCAAAIEREALERQP